MKASLRLLLVVFAALAVAAGLLAAEQLYTCGMHPQIIKKEPGNCPICGMKLTPIRANAAAAAKLSGERKIKYYKSTMIPGFVRDQPGKDGHGMDLVPVYDDEDSSAQNNIQIDAATVQRMNLRTALVEHGPVKREIRTVGTVAYNEEGLRDITTKYEGWLEKLYVNTTWASVKAGDPLFEIYSPDLYNAELNFVLALKGEGESGGPLTRAALARLQLFDIPAEVIAELQRTRDVKRTLLLRAPAEGVVIEKMGVAGQMMKPGERIYRLADLSSVWVQAQIYEKDLPFLKTGQSAAISTSYGPERRFEGVVQLLLPQVEEQTRTVTARIVLPNPDRFLRPGMFVEVNFASQLSADAVLVPDLAVLRSGERNTVFVALDGGFFEPREVKLGARSEGGLYQVLDGLKAGDRVVTSGQFMLDSESQLREAIQKMLKPAGSPDSGTPAQPAADHSGHGKQVGEPVAAPEHVKALALAAADAATPLATDDFAGYVAQLPALRGALGNYFAAEAHAAHGPLAAFKDGPAEPADVSAARKDFAPLSSAIVDLVRSGTTVTVPGLRAFECSMAKARWLQREAGTKNPFYGEKMLTCGEEIAGPKKTAATSNSPAVGRALMAANLPPGHPPIDAATAASFAQMQASPAAKAGDACGNCGMSAAQMAAGEPCEHDKK
jgi:multidrug efflux pump subunit AcrA (membrane-fusion protein)